MAARGAGAARSRIHPRTPWTALPADALRTTPPALPELNEPEVVRHYVNLSQLNFAVDTGFYPLGSCTMKFNPKLNEWAARLPGFANLHPMAPDEVAQGTLQLLWELEAALAEISGMRAVTLQPAAGAQGELTGILMIRAYHRARGDTDRDEVLVPDSSHGTNPATASMAGFRTITIPSAADGGVDVDAFRAALGPRTAAVMITNPSTLGLFEARIGELLDAVHAAGALAYMDGANLNAILGRFKPGEAGFDVMHFNVHKTFSTPHGGGGPGAGPVGVGEALLPYLPEPRVLRADDGTFRLERTGERPTSIGRLRSFAGNTGVLVRAYAYIRAHGGTGLREVSEDAVLAANYLKHRLAGTYDLPYDRPCKHEFVASASSIKRRTGRAHARHRQAAHRPRLPPADDLLPADRRRGHAHRAHRDRIGRDPRRVRRRPDRHRRRGRDGPGDRHERAAHRSGAPSRRGDGRPPAEPALAPDDRRPDPLSGLTGPARPGAVRTFVRSWLTAHRALWIVPAAHRPEPCCRLGSPRILLELGGSTWTRAGPLRRVLGHGTGSRSGRHRVSTRSEDSSCANDSWASRQLP